jgi:hypothetical protein
VKKVYIEKVICQKRSQISSIEEDKLQFYILLLPVILLLANFFHFSQQFLYSNFVKKIFLVILTFI